jgi:drug/metabolite transporter (DMT)-like permease
MSLAAFLLVIAGALVHALWNFAARQARGHQVVVWAGLWIGGLAVLPVFLAGVLIGAFPTSGMPVEGLVCAMASGLIHAAYFGLLGEAYRHGEISLVYPVARGSAIGLIAILAMVLLGERISGWAATGIALVCAGIFSLGRGPKESFRPWLLALCVGLATMGYSLVDKLGVGHIHPIPYILIVWLAAATTLTPVVRRNHQRAIGHRLRGHWRHALTVGIGSIGAYLLILFAMRLAPVSYVSAAREVSVVLGALGGFIYFGEKATPGKLVGLGAVVAGCCLIKMA